MKSNRTWIKTKGGRIQVS